MTVAQGPVILGVWCEICDSYAPLEEADTINGFTGHLECLPSHWVKSRDEVAEVLGRRR